MKKAIFLVLFMLLSVFAASPALAVTVTFVSGDEVADGFVVAPHPVWVTLPGSSWVSGVANSGYGGVVVPNTTVASGVPSYTLSETFVLPYGGNTGWVTVGADDTTGVRLVNSMHPGGVVLKAPNPSQDAHCAAGPIGCQPGELETLILTGHLAQGSNTLYFSVFQVDFGPTAAIWSGQVESVPEPATFGLIGLALVGVAGFRKLRPQNRH